MRLGLVAPDDLPVPPIRGGAVETTVAALAEQWAGRHRVTLFSLADPALPAREERPGLIHIRLDGIGYAESCRAALASGGWDAVVIFNRPEMLPGLAGLPAVLSLHTRRHEWLPWGQARRCLEAARAIVTVSQHLRGRLLRRHPETAGKTFTVHSGVDPHRFHPPVSEAEMAHRHLFRRRHGLDERPVILYAGRFSPAKGPDRLLRAVRQVPGVQLLLCGGAWLPRRRSVRFTRRVRRMAARLGRRAVLTGFIPPEEMPPFFRAADVLACPSRPTDALARVVYEGMASALPVVAFARGAAGEVITHGETGLLVRGTAGLAQALALLSRHPARAAAMGAAGRKLVLERYRWEDAAERWEQVLTVVGGRPSRPDHRGSVAPARDRPAGGSRPSPRIRGARWR